MRDFHYTVNVLVKAYLNETLEHGVCTACAVGNIIADSVKAKVIKDHGVWVRNGALVQPIWDDVFLSEIPGEQKINPENYKGWAKRQIDTTGYTWQELAKIEYAFELHNCLIDYPNDEQEEKQISDAMFNGLMAVVDVLADIHGIDLERKEEAKALFVKS